MITVCISAAAKQAFFIFFRIAMAGSTACTGEKIKQHQTLYHKTYSDCDDSAKSVSAVEFYKAY